jgi:hypothetical protein
LRQRYPQLEQIADAMPSEPTLFPMGSPMVKQRKGSIS